MGETLLLFIIGVCLSIDAFSIATVLGMYNLNTKKTFICSFTVGLFHFIMPLIGVIISYQITKIIPIDTKLILGIILILISLQMFIEYIKPSNKEITLSIIGILFFAFGVSLDSLSIGLGLRAVTSNLLLSSTIFTICSFTFTFIGLTIGKYVNKIFKNYSYLVGTIVLFILGIIFIYKSL